MHLRSALLLSLTCVVHAGVSNPSGESSLVKKTIREVTATGSVLTQQKEMGFGVLATVTAVRNWFGNSNGVDAKVVAKFIEDDEADTQKIQPETLEESGWVGHIPQSKARRNKRDKQKIQPETLEESGWVGHIPQPKARNKRQPEAKQRTHEQSDRPDDAAAVKEEQPEAKQRTHEQSDTPDDAAADKGSSRRQSHAPMSTASSPDDAARSNAPVSNTHAGKKVRYTDAGLKIFVLKCFKALQANDSGLSPNEAAAMAVRAAYQRNEICSQFFKELETKIVQD